MRCLLWLPMVFASSSEPTIDLIVRINWIGSDRGRGFGGGCLYLELRLGSF